MKKKIEFRKWKGEFGLLRFPLGGKIKNKKSLSANNTFSTAPGHWVAVEVFHGPTDAVGNDTQTPALFLKEITLSTYFFTAVTCLFIKQKTQTTNNRGHLSLQFYADD